MGSERGVWVIMDNGKVRGVALDGVAARKYIFAHLISADFRGARFRWTGTDKLFAQAPFRPWAWTGIEVVRAPMI